MYIVLSYLIVFVLKYANDTRVMNHMIFIEIKQSLSETIVLKITLITLYGCDIPAWP